MLRDPTIHFFLPTAGRSIITVDSEDFLIGLERLGKEPQIFEPLSLAEKAGHFGDIC